MRTHKEQTKKTKRMSKKLWYTILSSSCVLVIGAIITLSIVFGMPKAAPPSGGGDTDPPVVVPPVDEKIEFVLPMDNFTVGSYVSFDVPVWNATLKYYRTKVGMDFLADAGTSVKSVANGTVTSVAAKVDSDGYVVTITHEDGFVSVYKGLDSEGIVETGKTVKAGDVIGKVAASMPSEAHVGAHLHLELKLDGKWVDPVEYLPTIGDK